MKKKLANTAVIAGAMGAILFAVKENTTLFSSKLHTAARERCYGISKAGTNACGNARHSCAGRATQDQQPDEWEMVPGGTCEKLGGQLKSKDETAT